IPNTTKCDVLLISLENTFKFQAPPREKCACELNNSEKAFPHEKLRIVETNVSDCNSNITPQKVTSLLKLSCCVSPFLLNHCCLCRLLFFFFYVFVCLFLFWWQWESVLRGLEQLIILFIFIPSGTCQRSRLLNVTGPRVYTAGEYPGSYAYGAWGRDPRPEEGKESWYWLVMMTSSNRYSNYVRFYSMALTFGNVQIHSSNPTTNTIQGPNNVLYGGALYYNCYNQDYVCRFNLTTKSVTTLQLPKETFTECYPYTDLDLATDESGVWVVYTTTQDFGNLVLSKLEEGETPVLGKTWRTSVYKQSVTNTFIACGVLYATRYINREVEEIFYSFNTVTGQERFNIGIFMNKMSTNIQSLNYSPVDQMLHAYCDSNMVSYKVNSFPV
uniref:Olfactomedin-like domain-containing protein n=1 Tax=Maylandia zebra TaxID=106582 RepID=A0A3P9CF81_9CICH